MSHKLAAGFCCALALAPAIASAQVLREANVSLAMANTMSLAALASCKAAGSAVTVAVVDRGGLLKTLMVHDNANPHNGDLARRKAYTARTYRMTSLQFRDRSAMPEFSGQRMVADVVALGGGVPIVIGEDVIGAIAVSGTPSQELDEKCAKAGIEAVRAQLK